MNDVQLIGKMILDFRAAKVLFAAVHHDFFTSIFNECSTVEDLCRRHSTDPRATEIVLDALVALDFLRKEGNRYACNPEKSACLIGGQSNPMANNLRFQELIGDAWADLRNVISSGTVRTSLLPRLENNPTFTAEYIRGMKNIAARPAEEIAALFSDAEATRLLDVGAGPGAYALAFLKQSPGLLADLLDLPSTLEVTRQLLTEYPPELTSRVSCREGNYHHADFGTDRYDLVLMSHITHDEGPVEVKELIRKGHRALKPGGRIIIHDFALSDSRTDPVFDALFSVHMLVYTEKGRVYTRTEYASWLEDAGFGDVSVHPVNAESLNRTWAITGIRR